MADLLGCKVNKEFLEADFFYSINTNGKYRIRNGVLDSYTEKNDSYSARTVDKTVFNFRFVLNKLEHGVKDLSSFKRE